MAHTPPGNPLSRSTPQFLGHMVQIMPPFSLPFPPVKLPFSPVFPYNNRSKTTQKRGKSSKKAPLLRRFFCACMVLLLL
jgi:hypothetical protein